MTGRAFWTGDYLHDERFPHGRGADTYVETSGVASVMAAPLIGETGPFGALTIFTDRPDAWTEPDATLLEAIAAQAAIAITRARLLDELDRSREALSRRAEAEQALREIAARITALRDPGEILQEVVELASRLVRGQGAILDLLDPATGDLHWAFDDGLGEKFDAEERAKLWISVGVGATGTAVAEDRVVIAGDDLAGLFPPSPESTEFYLRTGFHSMIAAPITGDDGPLGVIEVYAIAADAFDEDDATLIQALASQAAIAITNARLITELASSRAALGRTADVERTLREISGPCQRDARPGGDPPGGRGRRDAAAPGGRRDDRPRRPVPDDRCLDPGRRRADPGQPRALAEIEVDPAAGVSGPGDHRPSRSSGAPTT